MRVRCAVLLLLAASALRAADAFPALWANEHAGDCLDVPTKGYGGHGAPVPDKCVRTSSSLT